jgi:hypothetical protein
MYVQITLEYWTSQENLSCSSWQSVCHDWTATDPTQSCMPGCESILAVSASWLISVCGFCLCGIRSWNSHPWWVVETKELVDLLQRSWVEKAGPIPWPGSSCEFTLLDNVLSDYVTEHIYIWPFGILLMEGHIEIEHVLRPGLFWDCMQQKVVLPFWYFGIADQSHL